MKSYMSLKTNSNFRVCLEYPDICPKCHNKIYPAYKYEIVNHNTDTINVLFSCPSCGDGFISCYKNTEERIIKDGSGYLQLDYINSFPKQFKNKDFSEYILNLSPLFCEIYNQSLQAETDELNQIAGMGYRKALEFLIKDYCINNNKNDEEKIKVMFLSQVINDYVDGVKIKSLAKASTWLGNDETHYIRKYEDKDINDLKKFIAATVSYIEYELISAETEEFVNN